MDQIRKTVRVKASANPQQETFFFFRKGQVKGFVERNKNTGERRVVLFRKGQKSFFKNYKRFIRQRIRG